MNSVNDIWDEIVKILSKQLTPTAISTWFSDCTPVEIDDCKLVLHTTTDFKRSIIISRFGDTIKAALSDLFSCDFDIMVLAGDEIHDFSIKKKAENSLPEMEGYTFDRFIVGNSNKFAHAAALAVAERPGVTYNPLFIYGNSGLGKTHLLLAIGQEIHEKDPTKKIAYLKGDEFTNQLIRAIKDGTGEEFRTKYRNVDLFLVDDIQFIAGKESTQEEFFHTFNALHTAGKQIVISSDKPPKEIMRLEERLVSRFEWGLIADIQKPDIETRTAILRKKALSDGLQVGDDVLGLIAERIESNIRELEGSLTRVVAFADLKGVPVSREVAEDALRDILAVKDPKRITCDLVKQAVADYYGIAAAEMTAKRRNREVVIPRQVAMFLAREMTDLSLTQLGAAFQRDHSTILHACEKVAEDTAMTGILEDLRHAIRNK